MEDSTIIFVVIKNVGDEKSIGNMKNNAYNSAFTLVLLLPGLLTWPIIDNLRIPKDNRIVFGIRFNLQYKISEYEHQHVPSYYVVEHIFLCLSDDGLVYINTESELHWKIGIKSTFDWENNQKHSSFIKCKNMQTKQSRIITTFGKN